LNLARFVRLIFVSTSGKLGQGEISFYRRNTHNATPLPNRSELAQQGAGQRWRALALSGAWQGEIDSAKLRKKGARQA
jgi:hypothetical protein